MEYKINSLEVMQIMLRVLCDRKPQVKADALFIHGSINNPNLDAMLLDAAGNAYNSGECRFVVINGLTADDCKKKNHGYGGYEKWREELFNRGISYDNILLIPPADHTAAESENFLIMAKEHNWSNLIIESAPHHQLRCFLQIVAVMDKIKKYFKVYNRTLDNVDWDMFVVRPVLGGINVLGQKTESGRLFSLIKGEKERIEKYAVFGKDSKYDSNATIGEALKYLEGREKI